MDRLWGSLVLTPPESLSWKIQESLSSTLLSVSRSLYTLMTESEQYADFLQSVGLDPVTISSLRTSDSVTLQSLLLRSWNAIPSSFHCHGPPFDAISKILHQRVLSL
ncbi:hypothetical protein GOP47_0013699 [Adiantum capillus-veneris]|uniref:Uncharacterized protein n=1 Tax=Adiantum capillus-veneris TaxID=13818 RepID=A0A9D4UQ88_ADICA|nr:hypothetical protein GOP47_0013699 [Adiantum capillus-veneris]